MNAEKVQLKNDYETLIKEKDEELDLDYCAEEYRGDIKYALSDSLGFGGHNAALVVKKFDE